MIPNTTPPFFSLDSTFKVKKRFQRKSYLCDSLIEWWGDGTSRNDVSPYECSGTSGPLDESSQKHNVPGTIHSCHFAPTKTYCKTYLRHSTDCNSDTLTLFFRNFSSTVCKPRKPFGIYKPTRCEGLQTMTFTNSKSSHILVPSL